MCHAVNPDDEAAVNYIHLLDFREYLDEHQKQYAVAVLKPPDVKFDDIPPITQMRQNEISDEVIDKLYSGMDNNVQNKLRAEKDKYGKVWKIKLDGGHEIFVGWAKPQSIEDNTGKKLIRPIHPEERLCTLLQDEMTLGKKVHFFTKKSPCDGCAKVIKDFKENNGKLKLHLHHDDLYVPSGNWKEQGVDIFQRSSGLLSKLDTASDDFTWTMIVNNEKIEAVEQEFNKRKFFQFLCFFY